MLMDDTYLVERLKANPDIWAVVAEGEQPPTKACPYLPSSELLAMARRVWEAQGPWALLGSFSVSIRDNELYVIYQTKRNLTEPVHNYTRGGCFYCGRPATKLIIDVGAKSCDFCLSDALDAIDNWDNDLGINVEPTVMSFELDPDQDR